MWADSVKATYDFIKSFKNTDFKVIQVLKNHNVYEFAIEILPEGSVVGVIEVENEIIDDYGNNIGFFGINFDYKILVYNLFKKVEE